MNKVIPMKISDILKQQQENSLSDQVLSELKVDKSDKFLNDILANQYNKTIVLKVTKFQDDIIQNIAYKKGKTIKRILLESLLLEAKKEELI